MNKSRINGHANNGFPDKQCYTVSTGCHKNKSHLFFSTEMYIINILLKMLFFYPMIMNSDSIINTGKKILTSLKIYSDLFAKLRELNIEFKSSASSPLKKSFG